MSLCLHGGSRPEGQRCRQKISKVSRPSTVCNLQRWRSSLELVLGRVTFLSTFGNRVLHVLHTTKYMNILPIRPIQCFFSQATDSLRFCGCELALNHSPHQGFRRRMCRRQWRKMSQIPSDSKWFQVNRIQQFGFFCFSFSMGPNKNNSSCCSAPQWFGEASIEICLYVAVTFSFQNVLALLRACMSCLKHILKSKQQEVQSTKDFEIAQKFAELLCIVYKSALYPVIASTNPCIESASGARPSRPRQVMAISHGSLALVAVAGPGFRSIRSWSLPMQTRTRDVRHFQIFTRSEMPWSQTFFCLEGFDGLMDWWKNTSSNWFGLSSMHAACQVCTCMSVEFLDCLAWTQGYFGYFKDERHPVSKET